MKLLSVTLIGLILVSLVSANPGKKFGLGGGNLGNPIGPIAGLGSSSNPGSQISDGLGPSSNPGKKVSDGLGPSSNPGANSMALGTISK